MPIMGSMVRCWGTRAGAVGLALAVLMGVLPMSPATASADPLPAPSSVPPPASPPETVVLRVDVSAVGEKAGPVSVVGVSASFPEGSGVLDVPTTVRVSVGAEGDSATGSEDGTEADYVSADDFEVVIPAGESSVTVENGFVLRVTDDDLAEGFESLSVTGSTAAAGISEVAGTEVMIVDDDSAVVLSVDADPVAEGESATAAVTAALPVGKTAERDVTVAVTVGAEGDTAQGSGIDYEGVEGFEVVIPAGENAAETGFTLAAADDDLAEGDETATVAGEAGEGFAVAGAALTIVDADAAITLSVDTDPTAGTSTMAAEGEVAEVEATASLGGGITAERDVPVSVTVGAEGDAAVGSEDGAGADYATVEDFEVVISAGESGGSGSFRLAVTDDETAGEGDESVTVSGEVTGASGFAVTAAAVTITDGDPPVGRGLGEGKGREQAAAVDTAAQTPMTAPTSVTLSVDTSSAAEGAASAPSITFTAAFPDGTSTLTSAVTVTVTVGKDGDSAVSGTDYTAVADFDMEIAAGSSSVTASKTLTVTDDMLAEGEETLTITGSTTAAGITAVGETTITITDAADSTVTLTVDTDPGEDTSVTASEDGADPDSNPGKTTVAVSGSLPSGITAARELEIDFALGASGDTATGSATGTGAGVDYKTISASAQTIAAGASDFAGHDIVLQVTDDNLAWEGDESVTVRGEISALSGFTVEPAVVYISDSDDPEVAFSVSPVQVEEGDGSPQLTVTATLPDSLTAAAEATITVSAGVDGDSAIGSQDGNNADFTNPSGVEVKIEAGASSGSKAFNLAITDDAVKEGAETVTITGSATVSVPNFDGAALSDTDITPTVAGATLTIVDNDDLITFTVDTSSDSGVQSNVGEADGDVTITVTAALHSGTAPAEGLNVPVTVGDTGDSATGSADGTAADYTDIADFTLVIASGQSDNSATKTLTITQDDLAEFPETITFTPTVPDGYRTSDTEVTIDDDDNNITLTVDPVSVLETSGDVAVNVTIALDEEKTAGADLAVSVSVGKDGDGATSSEDGAGADYTAVNDFYVQIHEEDSEPVTSTFRLVVTDDIDWEANITQDLTVVGTLEGFTINESTITISGDNDLNPAGCADGSYVDDHAVQTGLAADCRALINIRNHWVSTRRNYNWDATHPVLEWGSASKAKITTWDGVTVTDTDPGADVVSRVTKLEMLDETVTRVNPNEPTTAITEDWQRPGFAISGILPASLGDLTALEYLYLNNNRLVGSIPTEIGNLVNLKKLFLHGNLLIGILPTQLGSLTNLTELRLNNNLLRSTIPTQLDSLTDLTILRLDDNLLFGEIPEELGDLTNLTVLHLSDNLLFGAIPTELGDLTNLKELFISDNYSTVYSPLLGRVVLRGGLSGAIPKELGKLTNLEKLRLDDNILSGNIPADLGKLTQLEEMWLEDNRLTGPIPSELGGLSSLEGLDLSINRLSGAVPSSFGDLSNLEYLTLGNNQLSSLPPELGNLRKLESLVIRHNQFTSLPTELGKLVSSQGGKLSFLYIQDLGLSTPIPERLLEVPWIDLFAYDDPLDLIAFYDFNNGLATSPLEYEVWVCDVGGSNTLDITPQGAANSMSGITGFFREMSGGKFAPTFRARETVISNPTITDGGLAAARQNCRDQIRPNRARQLIDSQYRDTERKIIIVDNFPINDGLNQFYTILGVPPHVDRGEPGYQKLTVDSVIHVGGGTVHSSEISFPRLSTIAHEIGHDLQWPHSYSGRILRGGEVYEYDNRMDLMSGRDTYELKTGTIAVNRYASGWIAPEDVALHTGGAAEYVLSPLGEEGIQMLVIPTAWSTGAFYTMGVRVRQGLDEDVPLEGVEMYFVDQRHNACNVSFAGLCGNTRRYTKPVNSPNLDAGRLTIENVWDQNDGALWTNVGAITEEGQPANLKWEITKRADDKFTVRVEALPFQPVTNRSILGLPEDITVSAAVAGSNTVGEGGSRLISVTASYPEGSRPSRIPARVSLSVSGSATAGADYARVDNFALVIPAGSSRASGSFTLRTINDTRQENAETITIGFRAPGYNVSGDPVTLIIPVNDQPPPAPPPSGGGGGGGGSFTPAPAAPPPPPAPPAEPACEGRFCDEDGSVHQSSIEMIAEWRITVGCDEADPRLFCPSQSITRRQMAAFLYRAVTHRWGTPAAPERQELGDVGEEAWYRLFADWAVANGVIEAEGGTFNPGGVVTRADMARMLVAAFPHLSAAEEAEGLFEDVEGADEAAVRAMEGLFQAGVTRGCTTSPLRYCPDQPVTRAQMASFFVRALNLAPSAPAS